MNNNKDKEYKMNQGIITTNNECFDCIKGTKVTILKQYFYNGEHWTVTKELEEDIPSIFIEELA